MRQWAHNNSDSGFNLCVKLPPGQIPRVLQLRVLHPGLGFTLVHEALQQRCCPCSKKDVLKLEGLQKSQILLGLEKIILSFL